MKRLAEPEEIIAYLGQFFGRQADLSGQHVLITAGLNDPRVQYWEPAKWVARMRAVKTDDNLLLLRTRMGAGHAGASGRFDALKELAVDYAFALLVTDSN